MFSHSRMGKVVKPSIGATLVFNFVDAIGSLLTRNGYGAKGIFRDCLKCIDWHASAAKILEFRASLILRLRVGTPTPQFDYGNAELGRR